MERCKQKLTAQGRCLAWLFGIVAACAITAARAENPEEGGGPNYSAGKSAAQLFNSDCSGCHKSAQGLAKTAAGRGLVDFLRKHYTTSQETAALLADYLNAGADARTGKEMQAPRGKTSPSLFSIFEPSKPPAETPAEKPRRASKPADEKKKPASDGSKPSGDATKSSGDKPSQAAKPRAQAKRDEAAKDAAKTPGEKTSADKPAGKTQGAPEPAAKSGGETKAGESGGDNPPAIAAPEKKSD